MKIVTVVGARPQIIKAAALGREVQKRSGVEEILIHTGQHFDDNMSKIFFDELEISPPKYNLDIHSLTHGAMTGRMLEQIERILLEERPQWVLVYGDTNSTLAGALAARKLQIQVAHVEAGLRSFNMAMPEEVNRILTDQISDVLFCPTKTAVKNLQNEGFGTKKASVEMVGDVMFDVSLFFAEKLGAPLVNEPYVLCTLHRQENVDSPERLREIVGALNWISTRMKVILPIHPRTQKMMEKMGVRFEFPTIEPASYLEMMNYLKNCRAVLTDSGGLQKEAYFFQKPCLTLRDETEWVELVENGVNRLVGSSGEKIREAFQTFLSQKFNFDAPLYGHGDASKLILDSLSSKG
jgi:UDP-GlcNAc3NAcA epimerase